MKGHKNVFYSSGKSNVKTELTVYRNDQNEIYFGMSTVKGDYQFVALPKGASLKLSRVIQREVHEINRIEKEAQNG